MLLEQFNQFIQSNMLTVIGMLVAVAFLGSKIFQRLGIPQVVGFIILGVLHGPSGINVIPLDLSKELTFVSEVALGLIGFDIGSHLHFEDLRRMGWSIIFILFFEAIGTFLIVTAGVFLLTDSFPTALIFGALASATAPAATVDVLAEYDAEGPLTTTLLAVVGLDDVLALVLFSVASVVVEAQLLGDIAPDLISLVKLPLIEIGGSLLLGFGGGFVLDLIMRHMNSRHDAMAISIGFVLLGVGLSETLELSLILTTMSMGVFLVNRDPSNTRAIRFTIEQAGPVVYVLFFALVGARLEISTLPAMGALGILYIVLRSFGKFVGAWLGGRLGGAEKAVRENLGFGLLSQAGVAVGLALAASGRFAEAGEKGEALGALVLGVITATTFVVQIAGPIFTKFAIQRAGEIGQAKLGEDVWASEGAPE